MSSQELVKNMCNAQKYVLDWFWMEDLVVVAAMLQKPLVLAKGTLDFFGLVTALMGEHLKS